MDKSEYAKMAVLILGLVFLVMGTYLSYVEFSYLFFGKETTGNVTTVTNYSRRSRGHETRYRQVEFTFTETKGTQRTGQDNMAEDWTPPPNGVIKVQYTPGADGRARIAGPVKWTGFVILAIAVAGILVAAVWLAIEAHAAYKPRLPKKKKRIRYVDD